jgi:AraC-like DNA-binding protein
METIHPDEHRSTLALNRALDYARSHLGERITLQMLADLAGLSMWRFAIVFRQQMGVPPHRYISQLRIDHACELLRQGMSAADAADACGFYDQSHFSRHFKQACGMTPGQYAARQAGGLPVGLATGQRPLADTSHAPPP